MKTLSFLWIVAFASMTPWRLVADEPSESILWPQGLPAGAKPLTQEKIAQLKANATDPERINLVETPSLTVYRAPAEVANGCGMIICPGGGYNMLAWNKEGLEVAKWLNTQGVTAGVLKYRVPRRDPDEPHLEALQDAQRAVRLMRAQAAEWGIDKGRVGVLGFSAGGHLTIMTGLQGDNASYASRDAIDEQSCKPNFLCPIYAAYLGEKYNDRTEVALGSQVKVTPETPPMFLAVTADDSFRGVQAASLFIALKQAGVPAELHIFARGGHGYGIRASERPVSTWHLRLADWLRDSGYLRAESVRLFDGKSFNGWEGDTETVWRIVDGALTAGSLDKKQEKNNFLATTKSFRNFDLTLKWKLEGTEGFVNGGVQFRSKRIPNHHEVSGYQADLGAGFDGALYDESRRNKMLSQPSKEVLEKARKPLGEWNEYRIRAEGPRIQLWLNGVQTVDFTETESGMEESGMIAVQIHGNASSIVRYKDIIIEELSPK